MERGEWGEKNGSSSWYLRGSIFRVNTRTPLHSTRQRKSNSTWFHGPLSFGRADFVESANSSFRPSKISPDISWLYSMIPRPTQRFTSSAFFQTRCNSFVLSFQRWTSIAESKIIHFSTVIPSFGEFFISKGDEFFKRVSEFANLRICESRWIEANNNVFPFSFRENVFVLFGAQSIGVE